MISAAVHLGEWQQRPTCSVEIKQRSRRIDERRRENVVVMSAIPARRWRATSAVLKATDSVGEPLDRKREMVANGGASTCRLTGA